MTAYEMRISDWSSDVCSSDLPGTRPGILERLMVIAEPFRDLAKFGVHLQRHVGGGHHRRHTSARIMGIGGHILFFLLARLPLLRPGRASHLFIVIVAQEEASIHRRLGGGVTTRALDSQTENRRI